MLSSIVLIALALAPTLDSSALVSSGARLTYGELGSPRPDNRVLPGEIVYLSFDMGGFKVNDDGRIKYVIVTELSDATGKSVLKSQPVERDVVLQLGGNKIGAQTSFKVPMDLATGAYSCKVIVTDLTAKGVSSTIEQKLEVLPKGFGIVHVNSSADIQGAVAAPLVGISGQSIFIQFAVAHFDLDAAGLPKITVELNIYDKDRNTTLGKPTSQQLTNEGRKMDGINLSIRSRFEIPLNREGGYLIELKASDNTSKKSSKVYLPLRVFRSDS